MQCPSASRLIKTLEILSEIKTNGQTDGEDPAITHSLYKPGKKYFPPYRIINSLWAQQAAFNTVGRLPIQKLQVSTLLPYFTQTCT
jgi:hypothetical protein